MRERVHSSKAMEDMIEKTAGVTPRTPCDLAYTRTHTNRPKEKRGGGRPGVRLQIESFRQNGWRKEPERVPWLIAAPRAGTGRRATSLRLAWVAY